MFLLESEMRERRWPCFSIKVSLQVHKLIRLKLIWLVGLIAVTYWVFEFRITPSENLAV